VLAAALAACSAGAASPSPSGDPSATASQAPSSGTVSSGEEAVALVLASDERFAGIGPLNPDVIGQSAWYTVDPVSDGWTVVVTIGWGDCPAGCIEKHTWTYAVTTGGQVTLMAESGSEVPADLPG
jgi:hypothetical protein